MSPKVTDQLLENLSPNLCNLDYFYITGCPKVTERGITAVLSANETGILGLGLEGLAPKFVGLPPTAAIIKSVVPGCTQVAHLAENT